MNYKTLLLGTAAVMTIGTGAQAADLSIGEPVDYVRVCDAFGAGYWYIPGTDTCIKLGGRARLEVHFHTDSAVVGAAAVTNYTHGPIVVELEDNGTTNTQTITAVVGESVVPDSRHSSHWQFDASGIVTTTAKSMTEYGVLTGFVELGFANDADDGNNDDVRLNQVYLELGPVLMGHTGSVWNGAGQKTFGGSNDGDGDYTQIRLSWAMSGFGLMLGVEDPRARWGSALETEYSIPDIIGAMTFSKGSVSGKVSGAYAGSVAGDAWAIQGDVTFALDAIAPGDALVLRGGFGDAPSTQNKWLSTATTGPFSGAAGTGAGWNALVSFQHYWSATLSSAVTYSFNDNASAADVNTVAGNLVWSPVTGFSTGIEAQAQWASGSSTHVFTGLWRTSRDF